MSRVLIKSAWGSDDPTKAAFPFQHANAFAEAGHEVQIFLLGEAVGLMRSCVADAVVPVGWPPLVVNWAKCGRFLRYYVGNRRETEESTVQSL